MKTVIDNFKRMLSVICIITLLTENVLPVTAYAVEQDAIQVDEISEEETAVGDAVINDDSVEDPEMQTDIPEDEIYQDSESPESDIAQDPESTEDEYLTDNGGTDEEEFVQSVTTDEQYDTYSDEDIIETEPSEQEYLLGVPDDEEPLPDNPDGGVESVPEIGEVTASVCELTIDDDGNNVYTEVARGDTGTNYYLVADYAIDESAGLDVQVNWIVFKSGESTSGSGNGAIYEWSFPSNGVYDIMCEVVVMDQYGNTNQASDTTSIAIDSFSYDFEIVNSNDRNTPGQVMYGDTVQFELSRAAEDEAEVSMYVDHIGEEGVYNEPLSGNGNVFEYTFSESCMEYVFYAECTYVYGGYTFTQEIVRITPDVYEVKDITLSVFDDLNDTAVRVDEAGVTGKLNTAENRAEYAVIAANIPSLTVSERNAILNGTYANQEDAYDMLQVDENGNVTFPTDKSGMYEYTVCILKCDDENVDYESVLKDITLHVRYEVLIGVDVELSRDGDGNPVKISKVSDGGKEAFFPDGYFFLRGVQSEYGNVSLEISGNFEYAVSDMGNDIPVGRAAGETGCPFILTGDDAVHYYINHYPDFSVEEIKGDILPNGIDDGEECILDLTGSDKTVVADDGNLNTEYTLTNLPGIKLVLGPDVQCSKNPETEAFYLAPGDDNKLIGIEATEGTEEVRILTYKEGDDGTSVLDEPEFVFQDGENIAGNLYIQKGAKYYGPFSVKYLHDSEAPVLREGGLSVEVTNGPESRSFLDFLREKLGNSSIIDDDIKIEPDGSVVIKKNRVVTISVDMFDDLSGVSGDSGICMTTQKAETWSDLENMTYDTTVSAENGTDGVSRNYYVYLRLRDNAGNTEYRYIYAQLLFDEIAPELDEGSGITFNPQKPQATVNLGITEAHSGLFKTEVYLYDCVENEDGTVADAILCEDGVYGTERKRRVWLSGTMNGYETDGGIVYEEAEDPGESSGHYEEQYVLKDQYGSYLRLFVKVEDCAGNVSYYISDGTDFEKIETEEDTFINTDEERIEQIKKSTGKSFAVLFGKPRLVICREGVSDAIVRTNETDPAKNDYIYNSFCEITVKAENIPVPDMTVSLERTDGGELFSVFESVAYDAQNHCFTYKFCKDDIVLPHTGWTIGSDGDYVLKAYVPDIKDEKGNVHKRIAIDMDIMDKESPEDDGVSVKERVLKEEETYTDSFIIDTTSPKVRYDLNTDDAASTFTDAEGKSFYYGLENGNGDPVPAVLSVTVDEKNWYTCDKPEIVIYKDGTDDASVINVKDAAYNGYITVSDWSSENDGEYTATVTINAKKGGRINHDIDGCYRIAVINSRNTYYNYKITKEDASGNPEETGILEFEYEDPDTSSRIDRTSQILIDSVRPVAVYNIDVEGNEIDGDNEYAYYNKNFAESVVIREKNFIVAGADQEDYINVRSSRKGDVTVADEDSSEEVPSSYEVRDDEREFVWNRTASGVYWITVSGTDLAGNKLIYEYDEDNPCLLATDVAKIAEINQKNNGDGKHSFETKHKVLDKEAPVLSFSEAANTGLVFNEDHTKARLTLGVYDKCFDLYAVEAVLFDGINQGGENDAIKYYDSKIVTGSRDEWKTYEVENHPGYSVIEWDLDDHMGSYLRLFISLTDFAGNTQCYTYDFGKEMPFENLNQPYRYSEAERERIIAAIKDTEPFALYGSPELDVRFTQSKDAISRAGKVLQDGEEKTVIDFIFTDRTGVSVTVKDIPRSEMYLKFAKEGTDDPLLHIVSEGYVTDRHCFEYGDSTADGSGEEPGDDGDENDSGTFRFSAAIPADRSGDGVYSLEAFVPTLPYNEIKVAIKSGADEEHLSDDKDVHAYSDEGEVKLLKEEHTEHDGTSGILYSESFIKDFTVPVAIYSVHDGFSPFYINDGIGTSSYYYGLSDGVSEDSPMAAVIDITIKEKNWYEVDAPQVVVYKDTDGDGNPDEEITKKAGEDTNNNYVKIKTWSKAAQGSEYQWDTSVIIRPPKGTTGEEANAADGKYTIFLVNSDGTYYNYIKNDSADKANINKENELHFEYSNDSIQTMDSTVEIVIDTIRPVVTYSVGTGGKEFEDDNEYAYFGEDFTETLQVNEKNYKTAKINEQGDELSPVSFMEVHSFNKSTVADPDPSDPDDTGVTCVEADDVINYSWARHDEGIYRVSVSGTDLAGNRPVYKIGPAGTNIDSDRRIAEDVNKKNQQHNYVPFNTKYKVLDKSAPEILDSDLAASHKVNSGLTFDSIHSSASLDLFVRDKYTGLYSVETVLFDGGGSKYGDSSGEIEFYDVSKRSGSREEWGADLTENPITSEFTWDITDTGSYLRLFVILEDFAGNVRCYKYDADTDTFADLDQDGFGDLEAPYSYSEETAEDIIAAITDASAFALFGTPELDVRFEQTNNAISRAKKAEDGSSEIDFIYTDRSEVSIMIKDMPVSELALKLTRKGSEEEPVISVSSDGYDTANHCFKYKCVGTHAETLPAEEAEGGEEEGSMEKRTYRFSAEIDADATYEFEAYVPELPEEAEIAVSFSSGQNAREKDLESLTNEREIYASVSDGGQQKKIYLINEEPIRAEDAAASVVGIRYSEIFIKDTTVPVASYSMRVGYEPYRIIDKGYGNAYYYGLLDGANPNIPMTAIFDIYIAEKNWYEADVPQVVVHKDADGDGNPETEMTGQDDNNYVRTTSWAKEQQDEGSVWKSTVIIEPSKTTAGDADGVYTISLRNSDGTYYNYIANEEDDKANINDSNELLYEYDKDSIQKMDSDLEIVIDTIRPVVTYSTGVKGREIDNDNEYAYYNENFTETLSIKERNFEILPEGADYLIGYLEVNSYYKETVVDEDPGLPEDSSMDHRVLEDDTYTYSWPRSDEGVYWIRVQGTDLAGNKVIYQTDQYALDADKAMIDDLNGKNGNGTFETRHKVLDKTLPEIVRSGDNYSGLFLNDVHSAADLDLFVHDKHSGLYSAEAVLFDGGGAKYGNISGNIVFYDKIDKTGTREEWGADLTENPVTSEFKWNITDTGSYLRLFIVLEDFAGNTKFYKYDASAEKFIEIDKDAFADPSAPYRYSDETRDEIIAAISDAEAFAIYGSPKLDVRFEQTNDAISRAKQVTEDNQEKTVIDFVCTDRSALSVTIEDMPVPELVLNLVKQNEEGANIFLSVTSVRYDTDAHCFRYGATGTKPVTREAGEDEEKKRYSFGTSVDEDGVYNFTLFVPRLQGSAEIPVSITSGTDADKQDVSSLKKESDVYAVDADGKQVHLLKTEPSDSGVPGVWYSEAFIKDTVVPVANCIIPEDYMPSFPADVQGESVFYYGLEDGVDANAPKAARMEVTITEENWYDYDAPKFIIKRNGEDVTQSGYITVSGWKLGRNGKQKSHTATITIDPKKASGHSADGRYTMLLYNYEDGTYYNYRIGDGKSNINDANEYEYIYEDNGNTLRVNESIEFVIDTIRPKAVYSVSSGDVREYADDAYAYYKNNFVEKLTVYDTNISTRFVTAVSGQKPRTDSSTQPVTKTLKPQIDEAGTTYTYSCDRREEGVYWITSRGTDLAMNKIEFTGGTNARNRDKEKAAQASVAGSRTNYVFESLPKVIDKTAPVAEYRITGTKDKCHYDKYDFYNKDIEAIFDLTEVNFRAGNMSFTGTFGNDSLTGPTPNSGKKDSYRYRAYVKADSGHEGHHRFTISGTDKAGNAIIVTRGTGATDNDPAKQTGSYTTGIKVMDVTAPVYVVSEMTKPKSSENIEGTTAYYNTDVNMAFTVTDTNLDRDKIRTAVTSAAPDDYSSAEPPWKKMQIGKSTVNFNSTTRYPLSASASNNGVYRFEIQGEDAAGNLLVPSSAERNKQSYQATVRHGNGEFWTYNKVIDTIAPSGHIDIGNYYSADLSLRGGLGVTKSAPYREETSASGNIRVTLDHSPVKIEYPVISSIGSLSQNDNVTGYAYMASRDFRTDGQQVFRLEITLTDRAGNTTNTIRTNSIYLDVEAPVEDENAPAISIVAQANSASHGPLDQPLFNGDVPFNIIVSDPNQPSDSGGTNGRSSGLDQVYYTITVDDVVILTESLREDGRMDPDQKEWDGNYDDPSLFYVINTVRTAASSLNNNNIVLTVYATDHSGNKSQREYYFGIDIVNPTISVTYDNNDAQNDKYFKADRTAIITVTERNFDPSKITIVTNGGSQSDWEYINNGGNGDNDMWIKRITYSEDGDFTFEISGADLLDNPANDISYDGVATKEFTIDKTAPVLTLTFDLEKGYRDSLYFNQTRTAVVKIVEHNFNSSDAKVEYPGTIARGTAGVAKAGGWSDSGDEHSMQIVFDEDADYVVTAEYTDLAGNFAEKVTSDKFTIDKTLPEIDYNHDTVENGHAYSADIAPQIFFSDTNYNPDSVTFVLNGIKLKDGKTLELAPIINNEDGFGGSLSYLNIAPLAENDDIYHAIGTIVDRAGNEKTVEFTFSVNRFGSTWDYNDDAKTESLTGWYTNEENDVYLREVNVNTVAEQTVDMIHDTDYRALVKGEDYSVKDVSTDSGWKAYVYKFHAKNFSAEGKYTIVVHSKDSSGNENSNASIKSRDGAKEVPLSFTVDKTSPYADLRDVDKSITRYNAASIKAYAVVDDNLSGVSKVEIYVYPENASASDAHVTTPIISYSNEWKDDVYNDELDQVLAANDGKIPFEIKEHVSPQTVRIASYDNAGNVSGLLRSDGETEKGEIVWKNVLVTRNVVSQVFYNRTALIALLGACLLLALILFLIRRRKERENEQNL